MKKILWVGLSDKIGEPPLSIKTNTGKIVHEIELNLQDFQHHKTNLVNFAPINKKGKLRYPTLEEMDFGFKRLQTKILNNDFDIIVLLGQKVSDIFAKHLKMDINFKTDFMTVFNFEIKIISIKHPSYIWIYKRKYLDQYRQEIIKQIK